MVPVARQAGSGGSFFFASVAFNGMKIEATGTHYIARKGG